MTFETPVKASMDALREKASELKHWLTEAAMPAWSAGGLNPENSGFSELLDLQSGDPAGTFRRARVQPRQLYSVAEAARLGWNGPARQTLERGLDWYLAHFLKEDGLAIAATDNEGAVTDATIDLYNQAFALLGLAHAADALPERRSDLLGIANRLMDVLEARYRHPELGFQNCMPDQGALQSNPHMHLFEAFQALEQFTGAPRWAALADEVAKLAMTRFIDPVNGGLREFFADDWAPYPDDSGRIMEPGHQFEWAWLLVRWGRERGNAEALMMARRLFQIARTHGIDANRKVAIMALNDDFSIRDPLARLWGQTEWLKAAIALADCSTGIERQYFLAEALQGIEALELFLADVPAGLWRDKLKDDGVFVDEPAPASSFYHIVCAISELCTFAEDA